MGDTSSMNRDLKKRQLKRRIISNPTMRQEKEEDNEQVAKEAHKKVWKKRLTIMAVLAAAIAGAVYGGCRCYRDFQCTDYTVGWERQLDRGDSSFTGYLKYGSNLLKYNKDGISYVDSSGKDVWVLSYEVKTPIATVNGDYAVIADQQGNSIYICDKNGGAGVATTNLPIIKVTVSAEGLVTAVQEEQRSTRIDMFKKDGSLLDISIKGLMGGGVEYPLDISLSPDGTKLVGSFMYIESGSLKCRVAFYGFSEIGKNIPIRFMGGFRDIYETSMIPRAKSLDEVYSYVFADNSISLFSFRNAMSPELLAHIPIEEDVKGVLYSSDYAGVTVGATLGERNYRMDVYKSNGEKVFNESFPYDYRNVDTNGEHIFLYNEDPCRAHNMWGDLKFEGNFNLTIPKITNGSFPNSLIMTGSQNMKEIKLQWTTTLHKR